MNNSTRLRLIVMRVRRDALVWLREAVMVLIVLAPLALAFVAGVLFAVAVRIALAVREGFKDGQKLING